MAKPTSQHEPDAIQRQEISIGWRLAGLGMEASLQVVAGALLGWLFDRWRGTGSTGTLVGALIGIAVGMWSLMKGSLKLNKKLDELQRSRPRRSLPPQDDLPPPLPVHPSDADPFDRTDE